MARTMAGIPPAATAAGSNDCIFFSKPPVRAAFAVRAKLPTPAILLPTLIPALFALLQSVGAGAAGGFAAAEAEAEAEATGGFAEAVADILLYLPFLA